MIDLCPAMMSNSSIIVRREIMRKYFIISILILSVFVLNQSVSAQKLGFRFKLSGGYGNMGIGDPNALLDASQSFLVNVGAFLEDIYTLPTEINGEVKKISRSGAEFCGEAIITYGKFGLGLGLESLGSRSATSRLVLNYVVSPESPINSQIDGKFSILALTANLYAFFGQSPLEYYVFAGPGLFLGKATWDYLFQDDMVIFGGYFEDQSINITSSGFGVQGGLGIEYHFSPTLGFFAEGKARFCKLKDWNGDESWETTLGGPFTWSGKLWYYEFYDWLYGTNEWYGYADIFETGNSPSGDYARNGRAFEVDLTGFSLRAGICIRF